MIGMYRCRDCRRVKERMVGLVVMMKIRILRAFFSSLFRLLNLIHLLCQTVGDKSPLARRVNQERCEHSRKRAVQEFEREGSEEGG
jgi:hypothetical protein